MIGISPLVISAAIYKVSCVYDYGGLTIMITIIIKVMKINHLFIVGTVNNYSSEASL